MGDGGIDELMGQIPIGQLADQLGVSEQEAEQAVRAALPALVGGMQANAQDPGGAASLQRALGQHDGSLLDGGVDLDHVDTADGAKIVRNVFGGNEDAVVQQLGGLGGGLGGGLMAKLLPMLAPLLLSYLGKQLAGRGGGEPTDRPAPAPGGGSSGMGPGAGGMGPGSAPGAGTSSGGGGLGDILGGLLGGGKR